MRAILPVGWRGKSLPKAGAQPGGDQVAGDLDGWTVWTTDFISSITMHNNSMLRIITTACRGFDAGRGHGLGWDRGRARVAGGGGGGGAGRAGLNFTNGLDGTGFAGKGPVA